MRHLHAFVMSKQVVYLGVSGTPAWVVVKANECKPWAPLPILDHLAVIDSHYSRPQEWAHALCHIPGPMARWIQEHGS